MHYLVSASLVLVALIHLLPLVGVAGVSRINRLYGLEVAEPNLEILLRHRAVLFGLLGVFLVHAAMEPRDQLAAFIAAYVSVGSFVALALLVGSSNAAIRRVVFADAIALVLLVPGSIVFVLSSD